MPWTLIVDSVVAVLLVVTISYAITLNRRLGNLRRDRSELEKMAASFQQATVRAEDSIGKLKGQVRAVLDNLFWGAGAEVFAWRPFWASYSRSSSSLTARI